MSRPRTTSTKSKPAYPRLSFVPETPPIINNFPLQPPATPPHRTIFSSSPTARKLSKRKPGTKPLSAQNNRSSCTLPAHPSAPPSAYRHPHSEPTTAEPSWIARPHSYQGEQSVASDIECIDSSSHGSDVRFHRRLSLRSSRLFRRVSTHLNDSMWSHTDKGTNWRNDAQRSWTDQKISGARSDDNHPTYRWQRQNFSESSFDSAEALYIRPPLTRREAGSSVYSHVAATAPLSPTQESSKYSATLTPPVPDLLSTPSDLSHIATDSSLSCRTDDFFSAFPSQEEVTSAQINVTTLGNFSKPRRDAGLALAIADDKVSDEVLVERLERLRIAQGTPGVLGATCIWDTSGQEDDHLSRHLSSGDNVELGRATSNVAETVSYPSSSSWLVARRALLVVRELVRTERHYVSSLKQLLEPPTSAPPTRTKPHRAFTLPTRKSTTNLSLSALRRQTEPVPSIPNTRCPPLMASYARNLVEVGESLLDGFERDMTVTGISSTFINVMSSYLSSPVATSAGTGEAAFVAWCGVVGTWFVGNEEEAVRKRSLKLTKRKSVYEKGNASDAHSLGATTFSSLSSPVSPSSSSPTAQREPRVRDLAILPTQRVMRYVLLLRDLLAHTPTTSPSREIVSKAVDTAVALADKCDRAQNNSAFLRR
jgi:hypothetical protein